jgi:hypothetical protein
VQITKFQPKQKIIIARHDWLTANDNLNTIKYALGQVVWGSSNQDKQPLNAARYSIFRKENIAMTQYI